MKLFHFFFLCSINRYYSPSTKPHIQQSITKQRTMIKPSKHLKIQTLPPVLIFLVLVYTTVSLQTCINIIVVVVTTLLKLELDYSEKKYNKKMKHLTWRKNQRTIRVV